MSRTQICITVDVEFSIAGAFAKPDRYKPLAEPNVACPVDERDEGIGFILDAFADFGATGTFFVETLQSIYFGDEPMGGFARRIVGAGGDVELHLHPCWLHFKHTDWAERLMPPPNDSCAGRSDAELDEMIGVGCEVFSRWGLPRPIAIRAGSMQCDLRFYGATRRAGIPLASSIAIGAHLPADPRLHLVGGRHWIDNVLELPVLSFPERLLDSRRLWRALTITGCSWPEIEWLLRNARRLEVSPIVILTHPFEFVKAKTFRFDETRRNRVNRNRLFKLLKFVRDNSEDYEFTTFRAGRQGWLASATCATEPFAVPKPRSIARYVENSLNDHIWWY